MGEMVSVRPQVVPVLLPHDACPGLCPYCPPQAASEQRLAYPIPTAADLRRTVQRVRDRQRCKEAGKQGEGPASLELAFFGGDLWALPRAVRTALLDEAERMVRSALIVSIRLTLSPRSALRVPVGELVSRGVATIELPIHSLHREVFREFSVRDSPRLSLDALGRVKGARLRSIVHLSPGLPMSSHGSALATADQVVTAAPDGARVLPALALSGTRLGRSFKQGRWQPMTVGHAVATTKHMIRRLRKGGVEIVRVGLQPGFDLAESPEVLEGPYHQDLRLLVESEILREQAADKLTSVFTFGTRAFTVVVHPQDEGKLRGPENCNLRSLMGQFRLDQLRVQADEGQARFTLRVLPGIGGGMEQAEERLSTPIRKASVAAE
ncbi:MAG: hypothetical protein CMP23_07490 [Rickettsiales bacterium]|nr:hypothetical protein [Rickettsiales bacterium]